MRRISTKVVAKRYQPLLLSMDPTKGTKQGYHSTINKFEYKNEFKHRFRDENQTWQNCITPKSEQICLNNKSMLQEF